MIGKFIVIEGLEGAGKSSVIRLIRKTLAAHNIESISTREPGGTPMAEAIRDCVKHDWEENVVVETELLLMYAARLQLLINTIKPALEKNVWVVGDRHDLSTQAYQGGGRGVSDDVLASLREMTLKNFNPDLTIYMDVEPEVGLKRARGRGELDRIEKEGMEFFKRTRKRYLDLAGNDPAIIMVDANQEIELVHKKVKNVLLRYLS
ncbi:dTMP kinase [Alteromonas sp. ASW11-130]|uniref:dTMP kinase n=1 Tax=Alteromonas sp. ASW11-130 TaxID=3015775 RepID=UPI002241ADBD|nr:dTMP kinase [Alteromonas sp. ASW11-130]MCW8092019.1 dTMP kinase [Alteromonas sp. ASW11-130]